MQSKEKSVLFSVPSPMGLYCYHQLHGQQCINNNHFIIHLNVMSSLPFAEDEVKSKLDQLVLATISAENLAMFGVFGDYIVHVVILYVVVFFTLCP
jgi:hypothetical protein